MIAVSLRPTELGWKGVLLGGALAAAYFATAYHNLFFLLLQFGIALGALDALWALANVRGIRCLRVDLPYAAAGEARAARLQLFGRRRNCALEVSLLTATGPLPIARIAMITGETTIVGMLPPLPRGIAAVRALRLASRHPFGLFTARRDVPCTAEIVTGPPIADAAAAHARAADRSAADSIAGLRPFRAGDAVSRVHWKATARRGTPLIKEQEACPMAAVVVVDRRVAPAALDSTLAPAAAELLASRAAAQRFCLLSQGAGFDLGPGDDPGPVQRWLATATALPADAPPPPVPARAQP